MLKKLWNVLADSGHDLSLNLAILAIGPIVAIALITTGSVVVGVGVGVLVFAYFARLLIESHEDR